MAFSAFLCAGVLPPAPLQAEVYEVAADGAVSVRSGTGVVQWTGVDVAPAPPAGDPTLFPSGPAGDDPARNALTDVSGDFSPPLWRGALRRAADSAGISPALLEALVWQESRWNPGARSAAGALGLGQLMPDTARKLGVDPLDPQANLQGSARYLRAQLDRFGGNLELALAAYNAGPERVASLGAVPPFAETRAYIRAITMRLAQNVAGEF